jgi:hypothetical protein
MSGWELNQRPTSETSRNSLNLGADLTIGERDWRASQNHDQLFQTWSHLVKNLRDKILTYWELNPGQTRSRLGIQTQTKKRLFQKMEITGS